MCTSRVLFPQALVGGCRFLTSVSLLGAPHLSNAALMAVAESADLHSFGLEGEAVPAALISEGTRPTSPVAAVFR